METKVVVMLPPTKRRIRIRTGSSVYAVKVDVEIAPVAIPAPGPPIVMPPETKAQWTR